MTFFHWSWWQSGQMRMQGSPQRPRQRNSQPGVSGHLSHLEQAMSHRFRLHSSEHNLQQNLSFCSLEKGEGGGR